MNEQQQATLIEKYLEGTATADEREIVAQWYAAFDKNEGTFYDGDYDKVALSARRNFADIRRKLALEVTVQPVLTVKHFAWRRIAAGIALLLSAATGAYYFMQAPKNAALTVVHNAGGKIQQLVLPDSSVVWLNSRSEIQYKTTFSATTREVFLSGEAFFDVHQESKRPFLVHSNGLTTKVLGTSFNVNAYTEQDTIAITLVTGKIEIAAASGELGMLEPQQQLSYNRISGRGTTSKVATNTLLVWKDGLLQFDDSSMEQIASILERWYGYKITFEHEQLKKCRYSASFENTIALKNLLEILRQVSNVQYDLDVAHKTVTFKGKDCNN